jgi:hypothetical protein
VPAERGDRPGRSVAFAGAERVRDGDTDVNGAAASEDDETGRAEEAGLQIVVVDLGAA